MEFRSGKMGYTPDFVAAECKQCGIIFEEKGERIYGTKYGPYYDVTAASERLEKRWNTRH